MREYCEKRVQVGYDKPVKQIFDEIESFIASQIRLGWSVEQTHIDELLENIDLIFYRDVEIEG